MYEYESFADVAAEYLDRIRNTGGNQASQKIIGNILARFNVSAGPRPVETNIIDLF